MSHFFTRRKAPAAVLSVALFLTGVQKLVAEAVAPACDDHTKHKGSFLLLNAPSTISAGPDSLLSLDSHGNSTVFYGTVHGLEGLDDVACRSVHHPLIVAGLSDYGTGLSELLTFDQCGHLEGTFPLGTPGDGLAVGFDPAGNLYAASTTDLWKNGTVLATPISTASEIGKLAADSKGYVYITLPVTSQLLRVDQAGHLIVFADASKGLNSPYGIAVGHDDEVYVANNPPSAPAYITKFSPAGTPSTFAANISFQPDIRGLAYVAGHDGHGAKLYATLAADEEVLEYDESGNSTVFADSSDHLDFPASIAHCFEGR